MRLPWALLTVVLAGPAHAQGPARDSATESRPSTSAHASGDALEQLEALTPTVRDLFVPTLAAWLASARDAAVARGVEPIPPPVRAALAGHVPAGILDRVRWRVDDGMLAALEGLLGTGVVSAVTLDHVVLFANADDAGDPALWAHEIVHVMQYGRWGLDGFAARYLADHEAVENEAWAFRWKWLEATR